MSTTMRLILECLMLLLEAEEERCRAELKEHRHPLVRQAHLNQIDKIVLRLYAINELLNPPKEEEETDEKESDGSEKASGALASDSEDHSE